VGKEKNKGGIRKKRLSAEKLTWKDYFAKHIAKGECGEKGERVGTWFKGKVVQHRAVYGSKEEEAHSVRTSPGVGKKGGKSGKNAKGKGAGAS